MNSKFRNIIEIISVFAIVLSLIFLALEVKQSNQLAKATIRQALNETDMEVYKVQMDEDVITKALYKIKKNIPLDDYEAYHRIQHGLQTQGLDWVSQHRLVDKHSENDDGSKEYHDKLNYYLSCNNTSDPCNIAPGSLYSFRLHVDLANKIANGTISETNWELIDTINIYSYDVFILRLKNE